MAVAVVVGVMVAAVAAAFAAAVVVLASRLTYYSLWVQQSHVAKNTLKPCPTLSLVISVIQPNVVS